jgi:hypothetical protein
MRSIPGPSSSVHDSASVPVVRVLGRLAGVTRVSNGWQAQCPAHADRTASLSIGEGADGRCLLHCFAGCRITDVVAALDLRMADLFIASGQRRRWRDG